MYANRPDSAWFRRPLADRKEPLVSCRRPTDSSARHEHRRHDREDLVRGLELWLSCSREDRFADLGYVERVFVGFEISPHVGIDHRIGVCPLIFLLQCRSALHHHLVRSIEARSSFISAFFPVSHLNIGYPTVPFDTLERNIVVQGSFRAFSRYGQVGDRVEVENILTVHKHDLAPLAASGRPDQFRAAS
jgi:hypothetical protein